MGTFDKYNFGSIGNDGRIKASPAPLGAKTSRVAPVVAPIPAPKVTNPTPLPQPQVVPQAPMPQPTQNKFFSGNFLQKALDVVSAPYYGYTGLLQGMKQKADEQDIAQGRSPETQWQELKRVGVKGVPIRESIDRVVAGAKNVIPAIRDRRGMGKTENDFNMAKEAGIENETAQDVANFATSVAVPSLPIGKVAKVVSKIPGVSSIVKGAGTLASKGTELLRSTPGVARAIETVNPYFRRPEVGKMVEETGVETQKRLNDLYKLLRESTDGLTPAQQSRIGQLLEGGITQDETLSKIATPIREISDAIGKEAVASGLLDPASYEKYRGQYMSHIFQETLGTRNAFSTRIKQIPQIKGGFFKQRKGAEGYVRQFAPAVFKGLGTEIRDVETAKLFKKIATQYGKPIEELKDAFDARKTVFRDVPEGMVDASELRLSPKLQKIFKNVALPKDVAEYVARTMKTPDRNLYDKVLGAWKAGKTIYNPAYHVRNVLSNQILSDMSTGRGLVRTVADYVRSVRNYAGGGNQKFVKAAEDAGLIKAVNFSQGLDEFLETAQLVEKSKFQKVFNFPQKLQNVTEETAKLNVFRSWVEKIANETGQTIDSALKNPETLKTAATKAQEAIFSPYRISAAERSVASRIVPFYSFTRQVIPFTAKTYLNNPGRISKYYRAKEAIEGQSDAQGISNEDRPSYMKQQIRLPIKDKEGRDKYFDPSYIYPFTSTFDTDTTGGGLPFGLSPSPFVSEFFQQLLNKDAFFGNEIADSNIPSENTKKRFTHFGRMISPTFLGNIASKVIPALQGKKDFQGRTRDPGQAVLDTFGGIKTSSMGAGEIRSKQQKNDVYKLRSIKQEEQDIMEDKTITESERQRKLQQLREVYQQDFQR